jgi:hypothetical protein
LKYLLKAAKVLGNDDEALSIAIDSVAISKDEKLANQLIDFLLGSDGLPKVNIYFKICFVNEKSICCRYEFFCRILNICFACTWLVINTKKQQKLPLLLLMKNKLMVKII